MDEHACWQRGRLLPQAVSALARNSMPSQVFGDSLTLADLGLPAQ
jgi:hypothetical protein